MRQAVVIIHGIGEQRPMETLRAFVTGALGVDRDALKEFVFSKPDRIDDTLELRRLSVSTKENVKESPLEKGCETDFYELYWQHLMLGTTSRPVLEWALYLLFHPNRLNPRFLRVWWVVVAIMAAVAIALTVALLVLKPLLAVGLTIAVPALWIGIRFLEWLAVGQVERLVLGFAGDAFRYLNPDPPNVQVRRAIRTAGLTLLRGLHKDELRRYERIILVGHSLGSVIAYDLITWFWQEQHHRVDFGSESGERKTVETRHVESSPGADEDPSPLKKLDDPSSDDPSSVEKFRKSQQVLWRYYRQKRLPWLITDLVTLGSPLSHADVLLANGLDKLEAGIDQREFPTCPPQDEDCRDRGLLCRAYGDAKKPHKVRILHHGAPFAVTRWTNLYFTGDVIGGPVSDLFGSGIKDVKLCAASHRWLDRLIPARSHTRYWDRPLERHASDELWKALHLNKKSLYERLGGQTITAVVDQFVTNVAADKRINAFFANSDIPALKSKLVEQICQASGGPCTYSGKDMKTVHQGMGITDSDFNALVEDLTAALDQFKVPDKEKSELLGLLAPMKSDIVEGEYWGPRIVQGLAVLLLIGLLAWIILSLLLQA